MVHYSAVCDIINPLFELDTCHGLKESFVELPGAHQFYHPLKTITHFRRYLQDKVCGVHDDGCRDRFVKIDAADYVDLKYDVISQTLVGSGFFETVKEGEEGLEIVRKVSGEGEAEEKERIEVGVLGLNEPMDEESVTLAGSIHVVGEEKMSKFYTINTRNSSC